MNRTTDVPFARQGVTGRISRSGPIDNTFAADFAAETARQPDCSRSPPTILHREGVPKQPPIPIGAASAANASGFLLVSLSKMPRLDPNVFAPTLCAEAFPIKASDQPGAIWER